jgi:hypothetical protein
LVLWEKQEGFEPQECFFALLKLRELARLSASSIQHPFGRGWLQIATHLNSEKFEIVVQVTDPEFSMAFLKVLTIST